MGNVTVQHQAVILPIFEGHPHCNEGAKPQSHQTSSVIAQGSLPRDLALLSL